MISSVLKTDRQKCKKQNQFKTDKVSFDKRRHKALKHIQLHSQSVLMEDEHRDKRKQSLDSIIDAPEKKTF